MDKKKKSDLNLEIFRDIFQICSRVHGQNFDALPTDEDIVSFFKELGHTGEIKTITDIVVDQMHQPWRTFATIVNRSLSGKTTSLDKLRLSRAHILWGIPEMWETKAYKTYLGYAKGATPPKKARKFKKPASPKLTIVPVSPEEPTRKSKRVKRPTKKSTNAPTSGVVIRETSVMSLSKKKEKMTVEKRKGIDLLSEVALTEEAMKKFARRGRDEDDNNNDRDSRSEGNNQESDSGDDNTQPDSEKGSDFMHETDENESGSESDQEENEEEIEDDEEE
ncbi:hypothetical protein Tco_0269433 [Tanacetum coccineum]